MDSALYNEGVNLTTPYGVAGYTRGVIQRE